VKKRPWKWKQQTKSKKTNERKEKRKRLEGWEILRLWLNA